MSTGTFAKPWKLAEHKESFVIENAAGQPLCYLYHEDEPGRRNVTRRLTREDARTLAIQIAKLPETLAELRKLRASRDDPA
jgi:hypothetical protein